MKDNEDKDTVVGWYDVHVIKEVIIGWWWWWWVVVGLGHQRDDLPSIWARIFGIFVSHFDQYMYVKKYSK